MDPPLVRTACPKPARPSSQHWQSQWAGGRGEDDCEETGGPRERESVCVCVRERVCVCVCVCERERESVCVLVKVTTL